MKQPTDHSGLYDEAFLLLRQWHDNDDPDAEPRLSQWIRRSPDHRAAFERAQAEWALLGKARMGKLDAGQRTRLFLEQKAAMVRDHPGRTVTFATLILAVLLVVPLATLLRETEVTRPEIASGPTAQLVTKEYATPYGRRATHRLPDGSVLTMNWDSNLGIRFTNEQRRIELTRGEAVFTVTKDAARPFAVSVDGIRVRAVGTEFSVRKLDTQHADVAVTEGVVSVSAGPDDTHPSVDLGANEAVTVRGERLGTVRSRSADSIGAWRDGMLVFDREPLSSVLDELDRYTPYSIQAEYLLSEDEPVTATYFIEDADAALGSLAEIFDLKIEIRNNAVVVGSSRPERPRSR